MQRVLSRRRSSDLECARWIGQAWAGSIAGNLPRILASTVGALRDQCRHCSSGFMTRIRREEGSDHSAANAYPRLPGACPSETPCSRSAAASGDRPGDLLGHRLRPSHMSWPRDYRACVLSSPRVPVLPIPAHSAVLRFHPRADHCRMANEWHDASNLRGAVFSPRKPARGTPPVGRAQQSALRRDAPDTRIH